MRILLAIDGSAYTQKMLTYLVQHGTLFPPTNEYTLLTVQAPLPARAISALGQEMVAAYYGEEAEKITKPVVSFLANHGLKVISLCKVGAVSDVIAKSAEEGNYDLLLMGSRGHGALGSFVMGSVATQVLARCEVPVLVIR